MKNDDNGPVKLGWSDFARARHMPGGKHTWYDGTAEELLALVRNGWPDRKPGAGREGLDKVVIVPVNAAGFVSRTVKVDESTRLQAVFDRRAAREDGFVRVTADGPPEEVRFASVVLYSADALLENGGQRSGDFDWEVVCLLAAPTADEPMDPLTMARNLLEKPGGTYAEYSAREFAEAIWYWSDRASIHVPDPAGSREKNKD